MLNEVENSPDLKLQIRLLVQRDLKGLLSQYSRADFAVRAIAQRTGLSEKTLKRLLQNTCGPHYNTIRSFYSYFFKINFHLMALPEYSLVKTIIDKEVLDKSELGVDDFNDMLRDNKVFRTIFLYSRSGAIKNSWVEKEFGRYGTEIVETMLEAGILIEESPQLYIQGPCGINKGPQCLLKIMGDLLDHVSPDRLAIRGFNQAFYVIENVDIATKNRAIEMTEKFKREVIDLLINQSTKGNERLFVSAFLDTLKDLPGDLQ